MDWTSTDRKDAFLYELIDPFNLGQVRGSLTGVVDGEITYGYYTDTRTSATIKIPQANTGWIENSLVRISHVVSKENYMNRLGTFFVSDITRSYEHGIWVYEFNLASTLSRLEDDVLVNNKTCGKGSFSRDALKDIFRSCGATYTMNDGLFTHKFGSAVVYEAGQNLLTTAYDIADRMGARLEVNGDGTISVEKYVSPSNKTSTMLISGNMIVGEVTKTDKFYSVPNRSIVIFKDNDKQISGYADLGSSSVMSYGRRGKRVVEVQNISEMKPKTQARANELAKANLNKSPNVTTYDMKTLYIPIRTGTVCTLEFGSNRPKCMLQSRNIALRPGMLCSDVWREV